jgi:hypothetical protein
MLLDPLPAASVGMSSTIALEVGETGCWTLGRLDTIGLQKQSCAGYDRPSTARLPAVPAMPAVKAGCPFKSGHGTMSTDEKIIEAGVVAWCARRDVTDLQAKVIANAWHGGQSSALYSFTSTGAIRDDAEGEILSLQRTLDDELCALLWYVRHYGPRGPVDGWDDLNW